MSEIKSTLGPWEVDATGYRAPSNGLCVMAGDLCVSVVLCDSDKPQAANARLIAAAPELLDALQAFDALRSPFSQSESAVDAAWEKCSAAIAKALGE